MRGVPAKYNTIHLIVTIKGTLNGKTGTEAGLVFWQKVLIWFQSRILSALLYVSGYFASWSVPIKTEQED